MSAQLTRDAWDDAVLTLVVERPGLSGEQFLAAVVEQATDAVARLKERGLVNPPDDGSDA